jgi:hypothetical protein
MNKRYFLNIEIGPELRTEMQTLRMHSHINWSAWIRHSIKRAIHQAKQSQNDSAVAQKLWVGSGMKKGGDL